MTLMAASLRMTGSKAFRNSMGLWSLKERLRFQVSRYVSVEIQKPGQAYPMILHRVLMHFFGVVMGAMLKGLRDKPPTAATRTTTTTSYFY